MDIITKGFIVQDFDTRTAIKYSQIMMNKIEEIKKISQANGIVRNKMKIDHQIISCAIISGCSCIYSTDHGLNAFSSGLIEVRNLPEIPNEPPTLF